MTASGNLPTCCCLHSVIAHGQHIQALLGTKHTSLAPLMHSLAQLKWRLFTPSTSNAFTLEKSPDKGTISLELSIMQ